MAYQSMIRLAPMLQAPSLSQLSGIRHAFFTRGGGVSRGVYATLNGGIGSRDNAVHVAENRARMAAAVGVTPERFLTAYQIHSPIVVVAKEPWTLEQRPRADAMVTQVAGLALGVSTADCAPLLFADSEARVIAAAHAGWRGALGGVLEATLDAMDTLGAKRERIVAALGPTIRQQNYEVGPEFIEQFRAEDRVNQRFFLPSQRERHALFDLPGYIRERLERAGIGRLDDLGLCTYADAAQFFSYRRSCHRGENDYGRHINAIALMK